METLAGKVAIVTGAGRGIGAAIAKELAARGASVVVNDLHAADETVAAIQSLGGKAEFVGGDVAAETTNVNLVEAAMDRFGHVDIAVSNAVKGLRGPFLDTPVEAARAVFDVIYWGAFHLAQQAARRMSAERGGCIVFVSSVHAVQAYANAVAYNSAKAAVNHLARTIAVELAPRRIRANWVEPGWIDTPGERVTFGDEAVDRGGEKLLWGRLGRPEEIARAVAFLASADGEYITGTGLRMDGGFTLPKYL